MTNYEKECSALISAAAALAEVARALLQRSARTAADAPTARPRKLRRGYTQDDLAHAREMALRGATTDEIAAALRIPRSTIAKWIIGVGNRKRGRRLSPEALELRERARHLRKSGMTLKAISERLRRPLGTVQKWVEGVMPGVSL